MKQVAITAMEAATGFGLRREDFSQKMFAGESGVVEIRGKEVARDFPVPYAGLIPREGDLDFSDPASILSALLTKMHKSFGPQEHVDGIILGSGEGVDFELVENYLRKGAFDFDLSRSYSERTVEKLADLLGELGPRSVSRENRICVYGACASGNMAIGSAFERIRHGIWSRALVGAVDLRSSPPDLMSFYLLGALTTADVAAAKASRPFSLSRGGFVKSEGAALFILEDLELAKARGAEIHGLIEGYGISSDAYRITDGRGDVSGISRAMRLAIASARIDRSRVDYINAHGTSTPLNDILETKAIKNVFGDRSKNIPVSSLKSQLGHSTVACGAIEAFASILMLKNQTLAPTINYEDPDPDCDLDYVPNQARPANILKVLSNSFGFGGQNACLVISRFEG